jgi:hypothetical protein
MLAANAPRMSLWTVEEDIVLRDGVSWSGWLGLLRRRQVEGVGAMGVILWPLSVK